MKIYTVCKGFGHNVRKFLFLNEVEVEEKPRSYIVYDGDKEKVWYSSRISKDNVGCMDSYKQYSVGLTPQEAIETYREFCKATIEKAQREIADMENCLSQLDEIQKGLEQ